MRIWVVMLVCCAVAAVDSAAFDGVRTARTSPADTSGSSAEPGMRLSLQFGWFVRAAGTRVRRDKEDFLLTGDLLALRRSPRRRTWGVGLRVAGDDDGGRWGLTGVLRWKMGTGRHGYCQIAPGVCFAGSDNRRTLRLPAPYLTAEIGNERSFAFCASVEVVPYRDYFLGSSDDLAAKDPWDTHAVYDRRGTEVSWYLGGKLQNWKGLTAFLVLGIAVGIALAANPPGL